VRTIVFASIPLHGHLGPLLRQASELARGGFNVSVATNSDARAHVDGTSGGVSFIDLGPSWLATPEAARIMERISNQPNAVKAVLELADWLMKPWTALFDAFQKALARLEPDVAVVDFATTGAQDAAEAAGVPLIVNNADLLPVLPRGLVPFANDVPALLSGKFQRDMGGLDRALSPLRDRLGDAFTALTLGRAHDACRRTRGLPPVDFHHRLDGRRVLVNSTFGVEYRRPLPPDVHMVGPMIDPEEPALSAEENAFLTDGAPVVFVNLGTVAIPSREHVETLAAGLASDRFRALWVLRPPARDRLPAVVPPSVRVVSWVTSQLNVLSHPNVRAFVSHCGTNSVQESLWAGTPVVGFPMLAAQGDMGLRLVDAGAGVMLDKKRFHAAELRAAIHELLDNPSFARATVPIRESFEAAGGVRRAADLIAERAGARVDALQNLP
jgi:UDP:flavonoid glycosyltransferase YjiC (YdhE family)